MQVDGTKSFLIEIVSVERKHFLVDSHSTELDASFGVLDAAQNMIVELCKLQNLGIICVLWCDEEALQFRGIIKRDR